MPYSTAPDLMQALCFEMPQDGSVPEWVQLVPPGEQVIGVDGREWINDKPEQILARFNNRAFKGLKLVFDYEHATELKAPKGGEAPAAAWGVNMEIRGGGSIWVKLEWTERGRNSVASKEYRYLSPVLIYENISNRIVAISSVGLTNHPNLTSKALNHEADCPIEIGTVPEDEIRKALGLVDNTRQALNAKKTFSPDEAEIAAYFGNNEADIEKYGY